MEPMQPGIDTRLCDRVGNQGTKREGCLFKSRLLKTEANSNLLTLTSPSLSHPLSLLLSKHGISVFSRASYNASYHSVKLVSAGSLREVWRSWLEKRYYVMTQL